MTRGYGRREEATEWKNRIEGREYTSKGMAERKGMRESEKRGEHVRRGRDGTGERTASGRGVRR